jgi:glucose/mannose-6-phosphate isomerase
VPLRENPAKKLAVSLYGKIAVLYGAGLLAPVARRWKGQFNENSKTWAFYEAFPELNHNAVVGYEFPREMAGKLSVVLLRSSDLHPRILARYRITDELLGKSGVEHQIVDSEGESPLCQMMSMVFLGDWTSYYLAMLNTTDPTPVKTIGHLKKRLSEL